MRISRKYRLLALLAISAVWMVDASALALGRVRGPVLIGRPLNLAVPLTLEAGDGEPCVQGEVFYGDTRIGSATFRLERGADGTPQVRISAASVLDEPVATVYLRVGCGQQVTRRYVLLGDYSEEAARALPAPAREVPAVPVAPAAPASAMPVQPHAPAASERPASVARAPGADRPSLRGLARELPVVRKAPAATRPQAAAPAATGRGAGRLKLEPLDLSIELSPTLRSTPSLQAQPDAGPRRAEAAALWAALTMTPEAQAQQARRIEAMEQEVRGLRGAIQQNSSALGQIGQQLEKARSERNMLATLLVLVVLAALAGAGTWFWMRRSGAGGGRNWWQGEALPPESEFPSDPPPQVPARPARAVAEAPSAPKSRPPEPVAVPVAMVDLDLDADAPTAALPGRSDRTGKDSTPVGDFLTSQPASMRTVKAEELIDIQQQAEFFVSIGQPDQAVAVLEAHVHDNVQTSPLAWLDLLEMYHRLERHSDYDRIRREFLGRFNVQVPDYDNFRSESAGLEEYRRAMSRIVALWPSPRVLPLIEDSIFRKPGTPGAEPFELQAYRDLLLLYNVAKQLTRDNGSGFSELAGELTSETGESGFGATNIQPLVTPEFEPSATAALVPVPDGGVDIDLDALEPLDQDVIGAAEPPGDNLISFDFDLIPPPDGTPPSTSRR